MKAYWNSPTFLSAISLFLDFILSLSESSPFLAFTGLILLLFVFTSLLCQSLFMLILFVIELYSTLTCKNFTPLQKMKKLFLIAFKFTDRKFATFSFWRINYFELVIFWLLPRAYLYFFATARTFCPLKVFDISLFPSVFSKYLCCYSFFELREPY